MQYQLPAFQCFQNERNLMCIDFRRNRTVISSIVINGEPVEQVDSFKYLGVVLDTKPTFTEHVTVVQKKSQQRLHVLRKLGAFSVDAKRLLCLYRSIIEPRIMYCSTCYYPALSVGNRMASKNLRHCCQDHWVTYSNAVGNDRPCNLEESSCCRC